MKILSAYLLPLPWQFLSETGRFLIVLYDTSHGGKLAVIHELLQVHNLRGKSPEP